MVKKMSRADVRVAQFREKYAKMTPEERAEASRGIARIQRAILESQAQNNKQFDSVTKQPRERHMSNKAWASFMGASAVAGVLGAGALYGLATQDWGAATNVAAVGMIPGLAAGAAITSLYEKQPITNLINDIKRHVLFKKSIELDAAMREESNKVYAIAEVSFEEFGQYKSKDEMGE